MDKKFEVVFLEQALEFLNSLDLRVPIVISTHGIVKKVSKVPKAEIEKSMQIRNEYFEQKD